MTKSKKKISSGPGLSKDSAIYDQWAQEPFGSVSDGGIGADDQRWVAILFHGYEHRKESIWFLPLNHREKLPPTGFEKFLRDQTSLAASVGGYIQQAWDFSSWKEDSKSLGNYLALGVTGRDEIEELHLPSGEHIAFCVCSLTTIMAPSSELNDLQVWEKICSWMQAGLRESFPQMAPGFIINDRKNDEQNNLNIFSDALESAKAWACALELNATVPLVISDKVGSGQKSSKRRRSL